MPPIRIPSFLDLTRLDWLAGRPVTDLPDGAGPATGEAESADGPGGADAPRVDPPLDPGGTAVTASLAAAPEADAPADPMPAPSDTGPTLLLRPLPDGRFAFVLRSKTGATLVSGESLAPWSDPQAFGLRVIDACTRADGPRLVSSDQGPRLEIGTGADGLRALSRPVNGPAHAQALRRLIAVQADGSTIRVDAP